MRVLIAPDTFKDALAAEEVAAALAAGVRAARPDTDIVRCPLGDGGESTGRLLANALGAELQTAEVLDPLARPHKARWWLDRAGNAAIIEMAEASGLYLLRPDERDATRTTTYGTGQLIRAALAARCRRITLCVGGSATVDGGAGCLQALGWQLLDVGAAPIDTPLVGGSLPQVTRILAPTHEHAVDVEILCDVTNPLLGDDGAARVFGPQKGATPEQVLRLEQALTHWAAVLEASTARDVSQLAGGGAAGGLPAGLAATLRARLVPGFEEVSRRLNLPEKARECDLVLTGEGRLDEQTSGGKVVGGVARLGHELGKPVVAFVGAVGTTPGEDRSGLANRLLLRDIVVITPLGTPLAAALVQTGDNLKRAVVEYLSPKA